MSRVYNKPTCLDFFAGSGLVAEGLKDHFETVWANDICEKKAKIFCANHDGNIFHLGSISDVKGGDLPPAVLSWGSFPCQDVSLAGNMGGLSSSRSGLVWEWLRVLDEMPRRPPLAVAENVVGLVSTAQGEHYRKLHRALIERGYKVGAVIIDASHWVPQSRKRVFVIAVEAGIPTAPFEMDQPAWCHPSAITRVAEGLKGWIWWNLARPPERKKKLDDLIEFTAPCDGPEKQTRLLALVPDKHYEKMAVASKEGQMVFPGYKRIRQGRQVLELRFDGLAGCLRTPEGGSSRQFLVIRENNGLIKTRLLTIGEAAALMGAPASYKLPGTYNDGYKAMGDAVALPVSRYLAENLLSPLAELIRKRGF
ncbi:DNA cytosine methyltransferase [Methylomagnum ishizawai]|uniref:DNA cytosine methyltransferase n=1 Tax=Methylomagnum ishizawai TaxID=1760988 RepID=UPI001C81D858|nr:DNA cytosine methyltransferase [Methylomagnum ishizawai]